MAPRLRQRAPSGKAITASAAIAGPSTRAPVGVVVAPVVTARKRSTPAAIDAASAGGRKKQKQQQPPTPPETPRITSHARIETPPRTSARKAGVKVERDDAAAQAPSHEAPKAGIEPSADEKPTIDQLDEKVTALSSPPLTPRPKSKGKLKASSTDEVPATLPRSSHPKAALLASLKATPFPNFRGPPVAQYQQIVDILSRAHGKNGTPQRPKELIDKPGDPAGCGAVPLVLDGLIRTIISQNVTSDVAKKVKDALDVTFDRAKFRKMWEAGEDRLCEVVSVGGLKKKGSWIWGVLGWVEQRQREVEGKSDKDELSLEWLRAESDDVVLETFLAFKGVGLKTSMCMLLLNLGRDRFAVDTHVHRISQSLGWVPKTATADQTSIHLDLAIPDELKYPLHVLFWEHGKGCKRCALKGRTTLALPFTASGACPIEDYCTRDKTAGRGPKYEETLNGTAQGGEETETAVAKAEIEEEKLELIAPAVEG